MKGFKKVVVGTMAATMLLSSSLVAFAADPTGDAGDPATGGTSGSGQLEGSVNKDVFKVVLPTIAESGDTTFNFIADPEGLIKATNSAKYSGKTFEDGATLFFENKAADKTKDYSSTSDALTITNKSTMDVDVTLTATVSGMDGITLTSDSTFQDDTSASIYLALTDGTTSTALTSSGAEVTKTITKAPTDAYEVKYAADKGYTYELTTAASAADYTGFTKMDFQMTGKANAAGDWSQLTSMAPAVNLTWSVVKHQDSAAPSIATTSYTLSADTGLDIAVNFGKGDKAATAIATATFATTDGASGDLTRFYTFENNTIKVTASAVNFLITHGGGTLTITFNDTASTPVTVTVTAPATGG